MTQDVFEPASGALEDESIGIVGAGFGGLAAAAFLGEAGADVTVYEKGPHIGGVAGRISADGFEFDTGPSWYLMPEIFDRFFGAFDRRPDEFYDLVQLDPHYRVFWTDGDKVDVPADQTAAAAIFESYEAGAGDTFEQYLDEAAEAYEIGMDRFVVPNRSRFRDYISLDVVRSARGLSLLETMDDHVADYFEEPKLQQLLQYTLVFLGGAPYNTPALYKLMSHVDFGLGVYYPRGGMQTVVDGIATVASDCGADIRTSSPVTGVTPGEDGITLAVDGQDHRHDRVVCNAPVAHVERELLPDGATDRSESYWENRTYAPSAYMLYLGVEGSLDELEHHTLVLPTDWEPHFDSIFDDPHWPERPAYYINVPSLTDPTVAPDGHETVVILVPLAPDLPDDSAQRARFREQILTDLAENTGVDLHGRIVFEERACVSDFREQFHKPQGTALGLAHTLRQTGPLRPGHRSPGIDRLYYVGGDTNPGIGVPMCLLSGEHVAETICEEVNATDGIRGLISRS